MKTMKYASLLLIALVSIIGCSAKYGNLKTQSEIDSKVTQQELIDNWSSYNIWVSYKRAPYLNLIVFDPKNDDREILVGSTWSKVKDKEMWTEILKANTTSDRDYRSKGAFYDWPSGVKEIWGPDNEFYAFIIYQTSIVESINLELADEKTMRISWYRLRGRGSPVLVK